MNTATSFTLLAFEAGNHRHQWIDVRSAAEYASGHIPGAVNVPLDQIEARLDDLLPGIPIVLVCQAGMRARMVACILEPCRSDVTVLEGGTNAWRSAGHPLVTSGKSRFSLERQVRLIAGLLVLLAVTLSFILNHYWISLAALVGVGLTFAGLTDICLMASFLTRMPWNKTRASCGTNTGGAPAGAQPCKL